LLVRPCGHGTCTTLFARFLLFRTIWLRTGESHFHWWLDPLGLHTKVQPHQLRVHLVPSSCRSVVRMWSCFFLWAKTFKFGRSLVYNSSRHASLIHELSCVYIYCHIQFILLKWVQFGSECRNCMHSTEQCEFTWPLWNSGVARCRRLCRSEANHDEMQFLWEPNPYWRVAHKRGFTSRATEQQSCAVLETTVRRCIQVSHTHSDRESDLCWGGFLKRSRMWWMSSGVWLTDCLQECANSLVVCIVCVTREKAGRCFETVFWVIFSFWICEKVTNW
jgi:hypothetical protein